MNQTYHNWEMIITDDCSTDNTVSKIKSLCQIDKRIKVYQLKSNSGAATARNNSIKMASGRYIAFLDSDDMWDPHKLEIQINFMNRIGCALSYTSLYLCNVSGEITGLEIAPKTHSFHQSWFDNKCSTSTAIYDTQKVGKIFMPSIRKRQDWGLFMSILRLCKIAYGIKQPLAYYRMGQASLSKNKWSLIKYNIQVYREVLGWSYIFSILFFLIGYIPVHFYKLWLKNQYNK